MSNEQTNNQTQNTMPKKYCPIAQDAEGHAIACGPWCAWYMPAKNAKYAGCAMVIIGQNIKGLRLDHRPSREYFDNQAQGQSEPF